MNVGNGYGVQAGGSGAFDPNYGTQVVWNGTSTGDDSLSTQALPFAFPLPGGGTTSSIDVCSNGYVWLNSGSSTSATYIPAVATGLTSATYPARIAALWCDLNNNPSSTSGGGTVAFTASATRALITWDQVPSYGNIGAVSTVQLQLFSGGNFQIVYQSVNVNATTSGSKVLTGVTVGNNTVTPFETDTTTQLPAYVPFAQTAASPVTLAAGAGSKPLLGSTFTWEASNLNGSPAAVLFVGFSNPNVSLNSIGMTGCTLYTALTAQAPMSVSGGLGTFSLTVPSAPALIGGTAYSQVVALAAVNPLGLAASNGVKLIIGNY
jgi:hypothetical protein